MANPNAARYTLDLCDARGAVLVADMQASGKQFSFRRNQPAEATFTLSHEDEAASLLLEAMNSTGMPTLRAWRRKPGDSTATLVFNGYLAPFGEEAEETAQITPVFRSPFGRLLGDGSDRGRFTGAPGDLGPGEVVDFWAGGLGTDAGQIAKSLLDYANADSATGLTTVGGTFETTKRRGRVYQYANVGEEIVALSQLLDGFDFYERFIPAGQVTASFAVSPDTLAVFNVVARQGVDASASAKFEYGRGTLSNVRSVARTTQPPVNTVRVLGANGLTSTKTLDTSITQYGKWVRQVSASDVDVQATLDDMAYALMRPNPIKTLSFSPDYGVGSCPRFLDDFGMGDTVSLFARRAALYENSQVRVNGADVVVDDNGFEAAELTDPTTPGEEMELQATLTVEVL